MTRNLANLEPRTNLELLDATKDQYGKKPEELNTMWLFSAVMYFDDLVKHEDQHPLWSVNSRPYISMVHIG